MILAIAALIELPVFTPEQRALIGAVVLVVGGLLAILAVAAAFNPSRKPE